MLITQFASDNYAAAHPAILQALIDANTGYCPAYGADEYTKRAQELFKEHFGPHAQAFFMFNGTAANVLALQALTRSYQSVLCAQTAHINVDECGAPEKYTGSKLVTFETPDGKLRPEQLKACMHLCGSVHAVQPKVLAITQSTELGTVYTLDEIDALVAWARTHNLYVHLDGARLANAAAYLGVTLRQLTTDRGIDVVSFGGTKNGMLGGEAVVFLNPALGQEFKFIQKQGMQLASKMRFISAQFIALLSDNLWLSNAQHANTMAERLFSSLQNTPGIELPAQVQGNAVFGRLEPQLITKLQKQYQFYVWNEDTNEVRWMTSFATQPQEVDAFAKFIKTTAAQL